MKKTTEAVDLKKTSYKELFRGNECFFEREKFVSSSCKSTLANLPVSMQQAICSDPLSELLNEKNIFSLGENFLKKKLLMN
jgi:hypothetical protein